MQGKSNSKAGADEVSGNFNTCLVRHRGDSREEVINDGREGWYARSTQRRASRDEGVMECCDMEVGAQVSTKIAVILDKPLLNPSGAVTEQLADAGVIDSVHHRMPLVQYFNDSGR